METGKDNGVPGTYIFVLTVPMRNGNCIEKIVTMNKNRVLTVPMRNGNISGGVWYEDATFWFLPYL